MEILFFWGLSGVVGAVILSKYDRGGTGCLLGLLLGPIGWIIAAVMRGNLRDAAAQARHQEQLEAVRGGAGGERAQRKCPYCAEMILAEARVCRFCNRESEPAPPEAPREDHGPFG